MKRFSFMAFSAFAFLHIAGTTWLISAGHFSDARLRSRRDISVAHGCVVDLDARSHVAEP
jgi:hypothetical protein